MSSLVAGTMVCSAMSCRCSSCQKSKASCPGGDQGCVQSVFHLGHTYGGCPFPLTCLSIENSPHQATAIATSPSPRVSGHFGLSKQRPIKDSICDTSISVLFAGGMSLSQLAMWVCHRSRRGREVVSQDGGMGGREHVDGGFQHLSPRAERDTMQINSVQAEGAGSPISSEGLTNTQFRACRPDPPYWSATRRCSMLPAASVPRRLSALIGRVH